MDLKTFLEEYRGLYRTDFDALRLWASMYNHQQELINFISTLAADLVDKANREKHKTKEWAYYALVNLAPEINEDTEFPICINVLRLCDMTYDADKNFADACNYIMQSKNINWDAVETLHPEILLKYKEAVECSTQENQSK